MSKAIVVSIRLCPKEKSLSSHLVTAVKAFSSKNITLDLKSDETIPTGDIIISPKSPNHRQLILERKTAADLLSSVKNDQRYKQQTARMVQLQRGGDIHCGYIAEYKRDKLSDGDRICIEDQIATSVVLKHHLQWWHTEDEKGTAQLLVALAKKMGILTDNTEPSEEILVMRGGCVEKKAIRKGLLRMSAFFPVTLQLIDGVSEKRAVAIVQKYPTLRSLYNAYGESDSPRSLLANIEIPGTGSNKSKKLGDALSARIYDLLYCNDGNKCGDHGSGQ